MKRYFYLLPHFLTLSGLTFASLALIAVLNGDYQTAARFSLLVLLIDHTDGTLARKFNVRQKFPGISGEVLDTITDLVGLTFVPMMLFWKEGLFLPGIGEVLVVLAIATASLKYSRKEGFLMKGYSAGAPPIFFSVFLFYLLDLEPVYATVYTTLLIVLCLSPVKYPITSTVTTHWKLGYKSVSNYLTVIFFVPAFIFLKSAPAFIYWLLLAAVGVQLLIYPLLLHRGVIKPVFDRNS